MITAPVRGTFLPLPFSAPLCPSSVAAFTASLRVNSSTAPQSRLRQGPHAAHAQQRPLQPALLPSPAPVPPSPLCHPSVSVNPLTTTDLFHKAPHWQLRAVIARSALPHTTASPSLQNLHSASRPRPHPRPLSVPSLANPVPQASLSVPAPCFTPPQMPRHHFRIRDTPPSHHSVTSHFPASCMLIGPLSGPRHHPSPHHHIALHPLAGCSTLTFTFTHTRSQPALFLTTRPPPNKHTTRPPGLSPSPAPCSRPLPTPGRPALAPFSASVRSATARACRRRRQACPAGWPTGWARQAPSREPSAFCALPFLPCCCLSAVERSPGPQHFLLRSSRIPRFPFQCCVTRLLCMPEAGGSGMC